MIALNIAVDGQRRQTERIEGPSRRQGIRLAQLRTRKLAAARAAEAAGNDELAFSLDCSAWDIEQTLVEYGLNIETGRPVRTSRKAAA